METETLEEQRRRNHEIAERIELEDDSVDAVLCRFGYMLMPDPAAALEPPPAPGPFSMASAERTAGLLRAAGFSDVRTEEVAGRFELPDVDEYLSVIADTAGPIALALRGLAEADRAAVRADVEDSLRRFAANAGLLLPCAALCAVAS